jgi:hypothetical protein
MKKKLFDLTIEEFVRLLCGVEKKYILTLKTYPRHPGVEDDVVMGTYDQLRDVYLNLLAKNDDDEFFKKQLAWIENNLFDYEMELERIDIYNYLEFKTNGFEETRCHILSGEMEIWEDNIKEEIGCNTIDGDDSCDVFKYGGCEDAFHLLWLNMPDDDPSDNLTIPLTPDELQQPSDCGTSSAAVSPSNVSLPDVLNTQDVRKLFEELAEFGYSEHSGSVYRWRNSVRLFGYLVREVNNTFDMRRDNDRLRWNVFKQAFSMNDAQIREACNFISKLNRDQENEPEGYEKIKNICHKYRH